MGLEYVNRRGDRYYVLQGKTKTGKPKYYCSKKNGGTPVEQLPAGFEIHESPTCAIVSIRKIRPTRIAPLERDSVARLAKQLSATATIVEIEEDSLVVYAADVDTESWGRASKIFGLGDRFGTSLRDLSLQKANYFAMYRFALIDEKQRRYSAERWCFLGSIDHWVPLEYNVDLDRLARKYLPHLGRKSFFDLI